MSADLRTLRTSFLARPPRTVVFFDQAKPSWDPSPFAQLRRIIGALSEIWGGYNFLLVPYQGGPVSEVWHGGIRAYDPDLVASYTVTYADWCEEDPDAFEKSVRGNLDSSGMTFDEAAIQLQLQSILTRSFPAPWAPDDKPGLFFDPGADSSLRSISSPFSLHRDSQFPLAGASSITLKNPTGGELVPWRLATHQEDLPEVNYLDLTDWPDDAALAAEALLGRFNRLRIDALQGSAKSDSLLPSHAQAVSLTPVQPTGVAEVANWMVSNVPGASNQSRTFPAQISARDLVPWHWTRRPGGGFRWQNSLTIIIGDEIQDALLYLSACRLRGRAVWVRPSGSKQLAELMRRFHHELTWRDPPGHTDTITSASLDEVAALGALGQCDFDVHDTHQSYRPKGGGGHFRDVAFEYPRFLYKRYERMRYRVRTGGGEHIGLFVNGVSSTTVQVSVPHFMRGLPATETSWVAEFATHDFAPPPRTAMSGPLVGPPGPTHAPLTQADRNYVRLGADGESRLIPGGVLRMAMPVEDFLSPVQLRRPGDTEIMESLFADAGLWVRESDKGKYAREAVRRLGGLQQAAEKFATAEYVHVFDAFCAPKSHEPKLGRWSQQDGRWILSGLDIAAAVQNTTEPSDSGRYVEIVRDLQNRDAMRPGLNLHCERCTRCRWYSLNDVSHRFTCDLCGYTQLLRVDSHRPLDRFANPVLFYRLDEMVAQCWGHNGQLTVLALNSLCGLSREWDSGFHHQYEVEVGEVRRGNLLAEIDIVSVIDGLVVVGECKTTAKKKSSLTTKGIERLRAVADAIGADIALFVTDASTWSEADNRRIGSGFESSGTRVLQWTSQDLSGKQRTFPDL